MDLDRFRSNGASHAGTVRPVNQDAFVDRPDIGMWAVADGAGGHADGDRAARLVAGALAAVGAGVSAGALVADIRERLAATHASLCDDASRAAGAAAHVSASTVVILVARAGRYVCLWAGDSRAYRLRDGDLTQLTRDHSLVQELLDAGAITREDAARHPQGNIITRAIGAPDQRMELDSVGGIFLPGDRFLLCSDGLCKTVPEMELRDLMAEAAIPDRLIEAALARRARDNITAITIEILPPV